MRTVRLTKSDMEQSWVANGRSVFLTGTDEDTAERVTFELTGGEPINSMLAIAIRDDVVAVPVTDYQVRVVASPGDWDSPGTSEEL